MLKYLRTTPYHYRFLYSCRRTVFGRGSGNQFVKSLSDVASLLQNEAVKNIVVVAGAGISTPSGIPDFRWATEHY